MFSVVNGVLLKPLPYSDPNRLVWMYGAFPGSDSAAVSPPDFVDYRNRNEAFERLGAMAISPASVTVSRSNDGDGRLSLPANWRPWNIASLLRSA